MKKPDRIIAQVADPDLPAPVREIVAGRHRVTISGPYTESHVKAYRKLLDSVELQQQETLRRAREIAEQLAFLAPRNGETLH